MKQRPILFSTPMVEAILNQTKTQTRRIVKDKMFDKYPNDEEFLKITATCPYGRVGDVLWVRETWKLLGQNHLEEYNVMFKDGTINEVDYDDDEPWIERLDKLLDVMAKKDKVEADEENERYTWKKDDVPWKPSIHMPKDAARIFLQITDIRIERLQDISEDDAKAEGVEFNHKKLMPYKDYLNESEYKGYSGAISSFYSLWVKINGEFSLEGNPFVWVVEFKQISNPNE